MWIIRKLMHVGWFKRYVMEYVHSTQNTSVQDEFKKMEFGHVGGDGKRYYKYKNDHDMPTARFGILQTVLSEFAEKITPADLDEWQELLGKYAQKGIKVNDAKQKDKVFGDIIAMNGALSDRRKVLVDPELLIELLCVMSFREDEDPFSWDVPFQAAKKAQITADVQGGGADFFLRSALTTYFPSWKSLAEGLNQFLPIIKKQTGAFRTLLKNVSARIGA